MTDAQSPDQPSTHTPTDLHTHTPFLVLPGIDLRFGKVVRLAQGDPARETVYSDDPAAVAERWRGQGAEWVHVVNLDGAFGRGGAVEAGAVEPTYAENARALAAILRAGLRVQFGGGLRSQESLQKALDLGVERAVLGTAAIEQPELVEWGLKTFGAERIAAGLDARDGRVQVRGWVEESALKAVDIGRRLAQQGVVWCIFTDVSRDGIGAGLNLAATADLAAATGLKVIASGGVASLDDVRAARDAGLPGIIIGRALYEGDLELKEALRA